MYFEVSNILGNLNIRESEEWICLLFDIELWFKSNSFAQMKFTSRTEYFKCTYKLCWLANDLFANSRHMRLLPRQDWTNYLLLRMMLTHSLTHSQCFLICCLLLMRYICPLLGRTQDLRASCSIVCSLLLALVTHHMQNVMKFCCKLWL